VNDDPAFAITIHPHRETVRVAVAGEIDICTAGELDGELRRLMQDGFKRVVLDLRDVSFIDSTGASSPPIRSTARGPEPGGYGSPSVASVRFA
jgi:hypothetical protein